MNQKKWENVAKIVIFLTPSNIIAVSNTQILPNECLFLFIFGYEIIKNFIFIFYKE